MGRAAQTRRGQRPPTAAGVLVCLLAAGVSAFGQRANSVFSYDLERFKTVDPSLVLYREARAISVPVANPTALAVGPDSTLLVAGQAVLVVLDRNGVEQRRLDVAGSPSCIGAGADATIYAGVGDQVVVYGPDGTARAWMGLGEQAILTSIAVSEQFVFVADAGQHRVFVFDHAGRLTTQLGEKDPERGVPGFVLPSPYFDVVAGSGGTVWVANPGYLRLENYGLDGTLRARWGEAGMDLHAFCGCCNPIHFARLPDGSFVTGEKGIARVKLYDKNGSFEGAVAIPDQFEGDTFGEDLAVDPVGGRVLVLDAARQRVRVFVRKETP